MFRAAGFIQCCGPSWVGQRSEKGRSFRFVVPLDAVNIQSNGGHSVLWFHWVGQRSDDTLAAEDPNQRGSI